MPKSVQSWSQIGSEMHQTSVSFLSALRDLHRFDLWVNMAPTWAQLDPQNDPKWDPAWEQNLSKNGAGGEVVSETDLGPNLAQL